MLSPYSKVLTNPKIGAYGKRTYRYRFPASARRRAQQSPFSLTESKYFDSALEPTAIATDTTWAGTEVDPATMNTLFCPQEGSDINNRVGRKVSLYKLAIRGIIWPQQAAAETDLNYYSPVRIIVYQDEQTNGTQAQGEQLMESVPASVNARTVQCHFQNPANFGRFRVLKDKIIPAPTITSVSEADNDNIVIAPETYFKFTIKFRKPVVVRFNALNNGTVGDIIDNSFHIIAHTTAGLEQRISYVCRGYYKDQ